MRVVRKVIGVSRTRAAPAKRFAASVAVVAEEPREVVTEVVRRFRRGRWTLTALPA